MGVGHRNVRGGGFQGIRAVERRNAAALGCGLLRNSSTCDFFLNTNGDFVDVARPGNGEYGAYHVICEAHEIFRVGHVLPFIHASGLVDTSRHMPYDLYVRHLRQALRHIGISSEHAERFAGQSARAGAATTAARAGLQPHELCRLATEGIQNEKIHFSCFFR